MLGNMHVQARARKTCTCKERTFVSFSSAENGGESVSAV